MDIRHVDALDMCFAAVAARQEADRAIAERERLARSIRRAGAPDHPAGLRSVRVRVGHALLRAGAAVAGFSLAGPGRLDRQCRGRDGAADP
jgi:hypothetical protein